jgi:hypothetical protein
VISLFPLEFSPLPTLSPIEEGGNRSLWNSEEQSIVVLRSFDQNRSVPEAIIQRLLFSPKIDIMKMNAFVEKN